MSQLSVVVGGQFGSEAKGACAAWLTKPENNPGGEEVICVRVAGPNAGHTVVGRGPNGEPGWKWALRTVPVAAVSNPDAVLVIAAGSEIDLEVLNREIAELDAAGYAVTDRLLIDGQATVLTADHHATESARQMHEKIGSTGKGIGAARADRIMRTATLYKDVTPEVRCDDTVEFLRVMLNTDAHIVIEGTQGYGLGLHAGHYPKCTSSDCRAIDFLSMAGISPWQLGVRLTVYVVARTYPIRVAGDSGPMKGETSWDALGFEPELTTVTKKVRRVGTWDGDLVREAVRANGGMPTVKVVLSMVDYDYPHLANRSGEFSLGNAAERELSRRIMDIEREVQAPVVALGTGPDSMMEVML